MDTIKSQTAWFCLRAQPRREQLAAQQLMARVGAEVFSPRIRVTRREKSGLVRHIVEALFPGYVFAKFRYPEQVRHVLSTQGVVGLVTVGDRPPQVDEQIITFLREQVEVASADSGTPAIAEGDWVRVVAGAFRNTEGRVLSVDPQTERVRLLLRILGREVHISLSRSAVIPQKDLESPYPAALLTGQSPTTP